ALASGARVPRGPGLVPWAQLLTGFPHSGQNFLLPGTSCPSGHFSVCAAPHSPQNLSPGGTGLPHLMHGLLPAATVVSAPQFPQNFVVVGFIVPHFGHARCCCCCCCGGWAIIPPIWEPIAYPMPIPAPSPTPVLAPPDGFAAADFMESAKANCWYAAALVRPRTLAEAIFSRASLIESGKGIFIPLIWRISMPRVRKCGFAFASTPCSMSFRLAAKSTTFRPFAFILPNVTLSCLTSSPLIRSSISAEVAAPN